MNEFFTWLQTNYMFVVSALFSLITFIGLWFKKTIKADKSASSLLQKKIIIWINEAEKLGFPGDQKKNYVVDLAVKFLAKSLGWNYTDTRTVWYEHISNIIEDVLSTPTKRKENL